MEYFGWQLTPSASGHTLAPSQDGVFMKALDSIRGIPAKTVTELMAGGGVEGVPEDAEGGN